ncbi:MAG: hypothetical protein GY757_38485 [bacterium]|nr:hypothetical protein [bacterium]
MSGIFGIINLKGKPVSQSDLERMREAMQHRGRDGTRVLVEGPFGMGHLATHITPESVEEILPFTSQDKTLVIISDSRLDNPGELINILDTEAPGGKNVPDSILLLAAYRKWGGDCPRYLRGEFAFALLDKKNNTLFCARDHLGVRPLFYYFDRDGFIFASESRAIYALDHVPLELNEAAVAMELLPVKTDYRQTFFKDIHRLQMAHTLDLKIKENRVTLRSYWNPASGKRLKYATHREYAEELRELIAVAVRRRLRRRPGVNVGTTLSGGLDSSAITCLAARQLAKEGAELTAFSSVLPENHGGFERDEREYIRVILEQEPNIRIHYVTAEEAGVFHHLETAFNQTGMPPNAFGYMDRALFKAARDAGVRLLLWGSGGDHMASYKGRDSLPRLARQFKWRTAGKLMKEAAIQEGKPVSNIFRRRMMRPLLPELFNDAYRYFKKGTKNKNPLSLTPVTPHFAAKYSSLFLNLAQLGFPGTKRSEILRKIKSGKMRIEDRNIEQAHHGIGGLFPLFDKDIVDFFFKVPPEEFILDGWERSLFRRAMEGVLPAVIQWRKTKEAFVPGFHRRVLEEKNHICSLLDSLEKNDPVKATIDIPRIREQLQQIQPVKSVRDWDAQTQAIVVNGTIYLEYLRWIGI